MSTHKTCSILFSVLDTGILHLSASPSSIIKPSLLQCSAAAADVRWYPVSCQNFMLQRRSWSYYLNIHYREQMQTVTIISAFFLKVIFLRKMRQKKSKPSPIHESSTSGLFSSTFLPHIYCFDRLPSFSHSSKIEKKQKTNPTLIKNRELQLISLFQKQYRMWSSHTQWNALKFFILLATRNLNFPQALAIE